MVTIEGVPDGWDLIRIGHPQKGDWAIGGDGKPWQYDRDKLSDEYWPIIRKKDPLCTWQRGIFADGWICENPNGRMRWTNIKPVFSGISWRIVDGHQYRQVDDIQYLVNPPRFGMWVPHVDRIQEVGPSFELEEEK